MTERPRGSERVGPVLEASELGRAIAVVIQGLNPEATVEDRGAYLRISVAGSCRLTREAVESKLGRSFRLPADLEPIMPAFTGRIEIDEDHVEWSFELR